jgi:hypothetical protein
MFYSGFWLTLKDCSLSQHNVKIDAQTLSVFFQLISNQGGSVMKKLGTAAFLIWLLLSFGCSSTPSGTDKIKDLLANGASRLGQNVTVVGMAETRTGFSSMKMFKLFDGSVSIWVLRNDETEEPPEGQKVRVIGTLQQQDFKAIGKAFCIEAKSVLME